MCSFDNGPSLHDNNNICFWIVDIDVYWLMFGFASYLQSLHSKIGFQSKIIIDFNTVKDRNVVLSTRKFDRQLSPQT
jgi:hypothetical protein